jgi:hypothetical protein
MISTTREPTPRVRARQATPGPPLGPARFVRRGEASETARRPGARDSSLGRTVRGLLRDERGPDERRQDERLGRRARVVAVLVGGP